jgi:hypothetical protein
MWVALYRRWQVPGIALYKQLLFLQPEEGKNGMGRDAQ